jgi:hypothetical protein
LKYRNLPTLFGGLQRLNTIQNGQDQIIALMKARNRWKSGGEISNNKNTPPFLLIFQKMEDCEAPLALVNPGQNPRIRIFGWGNSK